MQDGIIERAGDTSKWFQWGSLDRTRSPANEIPYVTRAWWRVDFEHGGAMPQNSIAKPAAPCYTCGTHPTQE